MVRLSRVQIAINVNDQNKCLEKDKEKTYLTQWHTWRKAKMIRVMEMKAGFEFIAWRGFQKGVACL